MEKIIVLGTAGAVTNGERDNVSLVFTSGDFHLLIECGGSSAHKLAKLGISYETLEDIIITHTHLDHFYGLPGFIFSTRYKDLDRTAPLRIYCPEGSEQIICSLLDLFELRKDFYFPIEMQGIPFQENALVFENERVVVTSTPVEHAPHIPTYGIKIFSRSSGKTIVYSSDTAPSERLIRLAKHADILFHECAGLAKHPIPDIHSNALQVGEVARKSEVKKLVLLHIDTIPNDDPASIITQVQQNFEGDVVVASDFDEYVL
jgi:ribonuclease BN (tRNA processing enzyme)